MPTRDPWLDGPEVRDSMRPGARRRRGPPRLASASRVAARSRPPRGPARHRLVRLPRSYPWPPWSRGAAGPSMGCCCSSRGATPKADRLPGLLAAGHRRLRLPPLGPGPRRHGPEHRLRDGPGSTRPHGCRGPRADPRRSGGAPAWRPGCPSWRASASMTPRRARDVLRSGADGVVVGSACIRAARGGGTDAWARS